MTLPFRRRNDATIEERDTIDGERSIASVNKGLGIQTRITNTVIIASATVVIGFLLFRYYAAAYDKHKEVQAATQKDGTRTIVTNLPPLVPPAFAENKPDMVSPPPLPLHPTGTNQNANADGKPVLTPTQVNLYRRLGAGVFFKTENSLGAAAMGTAPMASLASKPTAEDSNAAATSDPLSKSLIASRFSDTKAYKLADPSLVITMGTGIPCTVRPAIDTNLPGIVTCIQKEDIYSTDHKVLLLERGTKWVGQQKFGMTQGQRRVGIVWTRGETPKHILVDVDSGTGDALGRSGIDGDIDNHFWDRFGAAIMLSLISDVGSYLSSTQQHSGTGSNNTTLSFPSTAQGAQSVMSDVLKGTLGIPPTLTKNQGADITIYVARDIDFRDVYDIQSAIR